MKKAFHPFLFIFLFGALLQAQTEYSLHLNGINQLGTATQAIPNITNGLTVEAWIKPENLDGNESRFTVVSTDQISGGSYQGFALRCGNNGDLSFKIGNGTAWNQIITDDQPLQLNTWQHVAATYDQDTFRLYINGLQVEQKASVDEMAYSTLPIRVGKSILGPRWFEGTLDDIRVWDEVKNIYDIQSNMCTPLTGNENNLIAYWKFDDDPDGTMAMDSSPNAFDLSINNITPSDWLNDENCITCDDPSNLMTGTPAATTALLSWYAAGYNTWTIQYGSPGFNLGNGNIVPNVSDLPFLLEGLTPNENYEFYVQENCVDVGNSSWIGPVSFETLLAGYCVNFDGSTQLGEANTALPDFEDEITVEAWINADDLSGTISKHTIVSTDQENGSSKEGFALRCGNDGDLSFVFGDGTNWQQLVTTGLPLTTNTWIHVAATYDSEVMKLYINGILAAEQTNTAIMANSNLPVRIGKSILGERWFDGRLDEVRIWSVAKSATDIQSFRCENLSGSELDLVAYYNFDDGPFSTILADSGPNGIDVDLNNTLDTDWLPDDNCLDCIDPADLAVVTYTGNSAELTWISGGFNSWTIEYGPAGFTAGSGTMVTGVDSNPYVLGGLDPDTAYDVYIQENCSQIGNSNWIGPVSFTTLLAEYVLHFDGSTQVGLSNTPLPNIGSTISVEAWINPENLDGGIAQHTIISNDNQAGGMQQGFALRCGNDGDLSFVIGDGNAWTQVQTTDQPLVLNEWQHVAVTYNQSVMRLYINGVQVATNNTSATMMNTADAVRVGKSALGPRWFEGFLDEIRIWDIELTTAQINDNFCSTYDGSEAGLVAYWNFDDGPLSNTLADLTVANTTIDLNNFTESDWVQDSNCECSDPADLGTLSISQTAAVLNWVSFSNNSILEYGPIGFDLGTGTMIDVGTETMVEVLNLIENTAYEFYVQSTCLPFGISEWTGPYMFTTLPICNSPSDLGATNIADNNADLTWTSGGSDLWNIQWGETGFAIGSGMIIEGNSANPYTLSGLSAETTYDYYVQDNCLSTESEWIGPFTFTTLPEACNPPFGLIAQNISDVSVSLSWIGGGASSWNIEYGPTGFAIGSGTQIPEVTSIPYSLTGLDPLTDYDFYVQDICANSESEWVGPISFSTLQTGVDETFLQGIEIYPNPTDGQVRILLSEVNGAAIQLVVTNALGQQMLAQSVSGNAINLDLSDFSTGVYFLRFQQLDRWMSFRLVKK